MRSRHWPAAPLVWAFLGLTTVFTVLISWHARTVVHPDYGIAVRAGHDLISGSHLRVFAEIPRAQMGPLALLLALVPRTAYVLVVGLAVLVPLAAICWSSAAHITRRPWGLLACAGAMLWLPGAWSELAAKGHGDDAGVLAFGTLTVAALLAGRRGWALVCCTLAVAFKPTAVMFVALFAGEGAWLVAAVAAVVLVWAPFAIAGGSEFFSAGRGVMQVGASSVPDYLGGRVGSSPPLWVRPAQLLGGVALVFAVRLRGHLWEGLLLAFTVRALLDPNPAPAYVLPLLVLALGVDLRLGLPVFSLLSYAALLTSRLALAGGTGMPRVAVLLLMCGALIATVARSSGTLGGVERRRRARDAGTGPVAGRVEDELLLAVAGDAGLFRAGDDLPDGRLPEPKP